MQTNTIGHQQSHASKQWDYRQSLVGPGLQFEVWSSQPDQVEADEGNQKYMRVEVVVHRIAREIVKWTSKAENQEDC